MAPATEPLNLYEFTRAELGEWLARGGLNAVHAGRIWNYLYYTAVSSLDEMTDLPPRVRARLEQETALGRLPAEHESRSTDGFTRKYLLRLRDDRCIETVLMRFKGRVTACVSSQAGCAMGCVFCATGQMGFTRHLTAGEIVAQALHIDRVLRETSADSPALADPADNSPHGRHERLRNLVLMGMGEPLHNYDAVMKALEILRDPNGLGLGARKITLSTVGVVPGILRLAEEARPVHLAVSLHAATQEERAALVPAARAWPLDELMSACRTYCQKLRRRIFFEWTLIEGKNDGVEQAHAVGRLLSGLPAQVNLIPLNPTSGYQGGPSALEAARRFQSVLAGYSLPCTIRQRRGIDISAGCGQLAVLKG
ncbi:23S rRNA (adenine(2503)-C(2))-methyltransferase RlmN [Opitutaceae bacterium EW11]|nr:23S rRNA (adenine(2503)-C(2))-methyltransferase RlmN [Opitutaceae bacterium EW11]